MATGNSESKVVVESDLCNCCICLEKFKTPKYLPCLHTFCQACLESYIVSSTKTGKTPPAHFNCPVCRKEVKPSDPTLPVEDWAKLIPVNYMINSLMEESSKSAETRERNDCDPCKYDGESINGEFWCFECQEYLCGKCGKDHVRHKSLRNHRLIPASDVLQQDITVSMTEVDEPCMEHKGEFLKVYCIDHQKMCCVLCLSTNHRKCENIKTLDEMAEGITHKNEIEIFSDKMKEIDAKVDEISARKRENVTSIQDQQTQILNKVDDMIQKLKSKLDKCHQEFKDNVAVTHKAHTTTLMDAAERIEIFQKSLTNFQKIWKSVLVSGSPKQIFVTFEKIKERIETQGRELEEYLKEDETISYEVTLNKLTTDVTSLTSIAELKVKKTPYDKSLVVDISCFLTTDKTGTSLQSEDVSLCINDLKPVKIWDVKKDKGWFTGGVFLNDGRLLLVDYSLKTLNVYDNSGKREICQSVSYKPWDTVQHSDNNIYVSSYSDTNIRVYTMVSDSFREIRSIKTDISSSYIYSIGITQDNHIIAQYGGTIYVMTMEGKTKRTIKRPDWNSYIATSTSNKGSVLYYCDGQDVISQSVDGEELMRYSIPDIGDPRGIALDKVGNIYVCGLGSKNVYVVSKDRVSSRVLMSHIEDVCRPFAIGFDRSGTKFFLTGCNNGTAAVYSLRDIL